MRRGDIELAKRLAEMVACEGGRVCYVGGCVRDGLLGHEVKDIDVEVHGVTCAKLTEILSKLGEPVLMGANFGVFGLRHSDLDIAMPMREGIDTRGKDTMEDNTDPFIGLENAARRRDLTINAMLRDVLTGELFDFFGGREDLENGILRHVNAMTFAEDPLRVFRTAQFAARFGFTVEHETVRLCASLDLSALARERVAEELKKALVRANKPSVFFSVLRDMGQTGVWFPETDAVSLTPIDRAAAFRSGAKEPYYFMLAALCAQMRCESAKAFLTRLTDEQALLKYTEDLEVRCAEPVRLFAEGAEQFAYMELFDGCVCPEDMILLSAARPDSTPELEAKLASEWETYKMRMSGPCIRGADLIAAGMRPGPLLGQALAAAHRATLMGMGKEEALRKALALKEI